MNEQNVFQLSASSPGVLSWGISTLWKAVSFWIETGKPDQRRSLLSVFPSRGPFIFRSVPTGSRILLLIPTNGDSPSSRYSPRLSFPSPLVLPKTVPRLLQHLLLEYSVEDSNDQRVCDKWCSSQRCRHPPPPCPPAIYLHPLWTTCTSAV